MLGYTYEDVAKVLPAENNVKVGSTVKAKLWEKIHRPVARSLGWDVKGTGILVPDFNDTDTMLKAARKRVMRASPISRPGMLRQFRSFVRVWVRKNLTPLSPECDLSFETWIENTKYPAWRKNQLRESRKDFLEEYDFRNKSFIKREAYREPKHARWINSRSDAFKCASGPLFHAIESEVYKHPAFVKHIPVAERSRYIKELLERPGSKYMATDHTSFEAHFTPEVMKACEMQLYWYMISGLPEEHEFVKMLDAIAAEQHCGNRHAAFLTFARMSGDMCTSLGNGFTNLMIAMFLAERKGWKECVGVVEGDDGLFVVSGDIPTEQDYEDLGFRIKLDVYDRVCDAGFCGIHQAEDEPENLIDPAWSLVRSGWTMSKWMHAGPEKMKILSRAKALSLLCEAPSNPITCRLALWIERATRGVADVPKMLDEDWWWMEQCLSANLSQCIARAQAGPTMNQRIYVAEKWHISVEDQIELENYFDRLDQIQQIDHPLAFRIVCDAYPWCAWAHTHFTENRPVGSPW